MVISRSVGNCLKLSERILAKANEKFEYIINNFRPRDYVYTYETPQSVTEKLCNEMSDIKSEIDAAMQEYILLMNLRRKIRDAIQKFNFNSGISDLMSKRETNNMIIKQYKNLIASLDSEYRRIPMTLEYYKDIDFKLIDNRFSENTSLKKETLRISIFNRDYISGLNETVNNFVLHNHKLSDEIVKLNRTEIEIELSPEEEDYVNENLL